MKAKHTQGKWRVGFCANHVLCGDIIVAVPNTDSSGGDVVLTYAEQEANARLISESPTMHDLLLKLQAVRSPRELHNLHCEVSEVLARIEGV